MLTRWTNFLNRNFDFGSYGEKPLSNVGGLLMLLFFVIVVALLILFCASEPDPEI